MSESLDFSSPVDPDDNLFNSLYAGSNEQNSSSYFGIENYNNLELHGSFGYSLLNCNVRSFIANGHLFESVLDRLNGEFVCLFFEDY